MDQAIESMIGESVNPETTEAPQAKRGRGRPRKQDVPSNGGQVKAVSQALEAVQSEPDPITEVERELILQTQARLQEKAQVELLRVMSMVARTRGYDDAHAMRAAGWLLTEDMTWQKAQVTP